jgi:hypothetical protein
MKILIALVFVLASFTHGWSQTAPENRRTRLERNWLDNRLIAGTPVIESTSRVRRRPRLGGLLNFYEPAA